MAFSPDEQGARLAKLSLPDELNVVSPPRLAPFRRLQWLALSVALVWLVAILTLGAEYLRKQTLQEYRALAEAGEAEIGFATELLEQKFIQFEQLAASLAFDDSVSTLVHSLQPDASASLAPLAPDALVMRVRDLFVRLALNLEIDQVFLLNAEGVCLVSSQKLDGGDCTGVSYRDRDYFNDAMAQGRGRQFAVGKLVAIPTLFFSHAIVDQDGALGVVVVRVKPEDATVSMVREGGETLVADSRGMVLSATNKDWVMKYLGEGFAPAPGAEVLAAVYRQETLESLPLLAMSPLPGGLSQVQFAGQNRALLTRWSLQRDFVVLKLKSFAYIERLQEAGYLVLMVVMLLGLVIIFLVERIANHAAHRRAHLAALSNANLRLTRVMHRLYDLAVSDSLTGLASRRFFIERLDEEVERAHRTGKPLSMLVLDIDYFKRINDSYGHPAGDQAIRSVASGCLEMVRPYDVAGRLGGEEIAILLPQTHLHAAVAIAERIRQGCAEQKIQHESARFSLTCSIGVAELTPEGTAETLFSAADRALYAAKDAGRNCVKYSNEKTSE